jgi:hypothetical protein
LLCGIAVSASASGLTAVAGANCPIMYSAPPATKIAETTVVSKKARTLLRGLRAPLRGLPSPLRVLASPLLRGLLALAVRLRCCDNAVLPSAKRGRQAAGHAGPLRPRQRV